MKLPPEHGDQVEALLAIALSVEQRDAQPLAVFDPDAVRARLPAQLVQSAIGGAVIRLPRALQGLVVAEDRGRQRGPGPLSGPQVDGLDRGIDVEGGPERLSNPQVIPGVTRGV